MLGEVAFIERIKQLGSFDCAIIPKPTVITVYGVISTLSGQGKYIFCKLFTSGHANLISRSVFQQELRVFERSFGRAAFFIHGHPEYSSVSGENGDDGVASGFGFPVIAVDKGFGVSCTVGSN
ncbi:hypothetical protein [Qipengyuania sp. ASV99]|uniref:hypothetical protein n=1 Tax=Qipengyuania sp. ASV99 TaxID=3399681 RepID=UPI003A4C780B